MRILRGVQSKRMLVLSLGEVPLRAVFGHDAVEQIAGFTLSNHSTLQLDSYVEVAINYFVCK